MWYELVSGVVNHMYHMQARLSPFDPLDNTPTLVVSVLVQQLECDGGLGWPGKSGIKFSFYWIELHGHMTSIPLTRPIRPHFDVALVSPGVCVEKLAIPVSVLSLQFCKVCHGPVIRWDTCSCAKIIDIFGKPFIGFSQLFPERCHFCGTLSNVTLEGANFTNNWGTPILLINSTVHVFGENFFTGNHAIDGGGMAFIDNSAIVLHNNSLMVFSDNHADNVGGAWYYIDNDNLIAFTAAFTLPDWPTFTCFINVEPLSTSSEELSSLNVSIKFINNTAQNGGNAIYGGNIDMCTYG